MRAGAWSYPNHIARSVDPIAAAEHSITRMAVTTEKEVRKTRW